MDGRDLRGLGYGLGLGTLVVAGVLGCGRSAERREAMRTLLELERMREAEPAAREGLLASLGAAKAQGEAAERARASCVTAYGALHESTRLEAEVRRQLASPSPTPTALADLQKAEAELERAKAAMPACDGAMVALRQLAR